VKEEKKITKAYEELQKIIRKETRRKLVKTVRNILEESSSEDQNKRKKKSTDSSDESPKKSKRKCKIKVIRVTGGSNIEGRRILVEKEENEVTDEQKEEEDQAHWRACASGGSAGGEPNLEHGLCERCD
jgi:hypothetical protein